jgi:hypothetical protein
MTPSVSSRPLAATAAPPARVTSAVAATAQILSLLSIVLLSVSIAEAHPDTRNDEQTPECVRHSAQKSYGAVQSSERLRGPMRRDTPAV